MAQAPEFPAGTIAPVCPHFFVCGGCDAQDVPYADQIATKDAWLRALFGPQHEGKWLPFRASPEPYPMYYRGKIRFGFTMDDGLVSVSRHRKGEERAEVAVDACYLQSVQAMAVARYTAVFATENGWQPYDAVTGTGWLKHVLVREGKRTGEMLVALVTDMGSGGVQKWKEGLIKRFPEAISVFHCVSWGKSLERTEDTLLHGEPGIHEIVGDKRFFISPHAFFQPNAEMVGTLYETVRESVIARSPKVVWDLYAGSATIGAYLSDTCEEVVSIENAPSNIADAEKNIALNGISNLRMVGGAVEEVLTSAFLQSQKHPNVIVIDPPRSGLSERIRNLLPNLQPHTLVYVSCNPVTCARDVRELTRRGYAITSLRGLDMFPHTRHCEMVVELERK